MPPADNKPPFPISPIRVRHLRSSISKAPVQTQIGSVTVTKPKSKLQSEYESISTELTKMVNKEGNGKPGKSNSSPLFERGRFYEEYSARRNERLKRKKSGEEEEQQSNKTICDLSFVSEPVKKRNVKKFDDFNCSVSKTTPLLEINETVNPTVVVPRYSLRSRTKMPPLPLPPSSVRGGGRKPAATRARKS